VKLTVAGVGVEREASERLAEELGVNDRCEFLGMVDHARLDEIYADAGVFVFPSLRETGGAVVLEAMSHGLPCVVAGWGGPAQYTGSAGIRLGVNSPEELEDELVKELESLLRNPERGRELGRLARERIVERYLWDQKAARLHQMVLERLASSAWRHGQDDSRCQRPTDVPSSADSWANANV
jgi:glycosyltransferase involved in cell wall biosynthesis